ncbi:MAG: CRISPR-associated endonuclease Cas1 [Turneriella sp.]|nr:CRISPR-associated endonuclease Cas1 [Turneriella sp.]
MAFNSEPIPLRALNEYAYCPRLFHFMYVEGIFTGNPDVEEGALAHEKAEKRSDRIRKKNTKTGGETAGTSTEPDWPTVPKNLKFGDGATLVGVLDALEVEDGKLIPVEAKKSAAPISGPIYWGNFQLPAIAWYNDQLQILAQIRLLRDNGYSCDEGILFYRESKRRVHVPYNAQADEILEALISVIHSHDTFVRPPPLLHSRKCIRCSLSEICLPDETNAMNGLENESLSRRVLPARDDKGSLYLMDHQCRLGVEGEQLKVTGKETLKIPFRDIVSVCVLSNAQISTQTLKACFQRDIRVNFFSMGGRFQGVASAFAGKNLKLRSLQFTKLSDFALPLARSLIAAKISNQKTIIRRNHESAESDEILANFTELVSKVENAENSEEIRGYEGAAARLYFRQLAEMLSKNGGSFDFQNRNRRPPKDPVNALLSFAYTLLLNDCVGAVIAVGLEPGLGFFHTFEAGRPALGLDIMEPYRAIIADSAVIRCIQTKMVTIDDFQITPAGCVMKKSAKTAIIQAYERRMNQLVRHPHFDYHLSYRRILEADVRLLSRFLEGDIKSWKPLRVR